MSTISPELLKSVLARAEEIQAASDISASDDAVTQIVKAATEAGLSEDAIMQAIRERLGVVTEPLTQGSMVFAKSADGYFYAAEVMSMSAGTASVRFMAGAELTLARSDLRPLQLTPGQKVFCPWPDWGWWNCTVVKYDAQSQMIEVSDGWSQETESFSLGSVRLAKGDSQKEIPLMVRVKWWGAMAVGIALGSAVTWILMRR